ncbi:hypothetical protein D9C73_026485 [Collichthys lucidus]|uniref:Uncharacterized protein n=1 Tax=Collichthys lucidus TaxID=240159 RepID=A0A4U5VRU6_COLLU|nr:hypothetical protein D9C73_026485 [Collichthys lucidus]
MKRQGREPSVQPGKQGRAMAESMQQQTPTTTRLALLPHTVWGLWKEEGGAPLLSLWHTALSPRSCTQKNRSGKVAGSARHPGRSTFYAVLPVGGVKAPLGIPALPNGQRHWFTALGSGGGEPRRDGETVHIKPSLPGLPLSTPQQRSMTED